MTSDELISTLAGNLEAKVAADASLQGLFTREDVVSALEMGSALEGMLDLSPLREALIEKGVPSDRVEATLDELGVAAKRNGFELAEGMFHEASPDDVVASILEAAPRRVAPAIDGFLPAAEIQKERDTMDRVLVSVAVRNDKLEGVDLDQFRDALSAALDAATSSGRLELQSVYAFLQGAGLDEQTCNETVLTLAQPGLPGYSGANKTRYQIELPQGLAALSEPERKAVLDVFNRRCPSDAVAPARKMPRPAKKAEDKRAAPLPGLPPPEKEKKKRSPVQNVVVFGGALLVLAVIGMLILTSMAKREEVKDVADTFTPPSGGMPCSQVLKRGNALYCGIKADTLADIGQRPGGEIKSMKQKTTEAAVAAGYSSVVFGLHVRR